MILSCMGDQDAELSNPESLENNMELKLLRKSNTTCGHKKSYSFHDNQQIDYNLLLNPMNPKTSLLFSYLNGNVKPASICSIMEKLEVEYTINRLGLDSVKLNNRRKDIIIGILKQIKNERMTNQEKSVFISFKLDLSTDKMSPYYSTIKDNFEHIIND